MTRSEGRPSYFFTAFFFAFSNAAATTLWVNHDLFHLPLWAQWIVYSIGMACGLGGIAGWFLKY